MPSGLRCAIPIAFVFQHHADPVDRTRAAFVAERIPSIKIEGVRCVWNVCSDKMPIGVP